MIYPKAPNENSPVLTPGHPWHARDGGRRANRRCSPLGEGGRGDQTRGTGHDLGIASSGPLGVRHRSAARRRSKDRPPYIAKGLAPPTYKARPPRPRLIDPFDALSARAARLLPGPDRAPIVREIRERGSGRLYSGPRRLRELRPIRPPPLRGALRDAARRAGAGRLRPVRGRVRRRAGRQAHRLAVLDGAGLRRLIWARFVIHQDLQSVLRCHIAALEAIGGAPREILYDRMKTAVIGEEADGLVVYNRGLSTSPAITAFSRAPAGPIAQRPRARSTAVPIYPRGLLPRRRLPQSRRSERPIAPLAGQGRQSARARHHPSRRQ